MVPPSGNMTVGPQQFWLGTSRTGQQVRFWIDTTTVHLSIGGWRIKTVPVPAVRGGPGPAPAARCPSGRTAARGERTGSAGRTSCVEVQRLVDAAGIVTLANQVIQVGSPLAGQRARIRLDGGVMHVITQDGVLWRTLPCPIPPAQRHKLKAPPRRTRPTSPAHWPSSGGISRGGIQVARQRIQVGMTHPARSSPSTSPRHRSGSSTSTAS